MPDAQSLRPENYDPRSELRQLQERAGRVTDESLLSTREMVRMCEETKDTGFQILGALDEQGEQLERLDDGMNRFRAEMQKADKNLAEMEKCCGIFVLPWKKGASFKEDKSTWKGNDDGKVVNSQPQRVTDGHAGAGPQAGYLQRITNDAREDEMENNLSQVTTMVGSFRNMAIDIASELDIQDRQIESIKQKCEDNTISVEAANQRANDLLKS